MMAIAITRKKTEGRTLKRICVTAPIRPWMLRSRRVMIAPTPSLLCRRSGMLWSLPTVASSSAY
ncbi:MAG TPA: hypothetical protein VFN79_06885 [Steroidobacteraceae bacterium]|nr:hypothetical protein [Steroidobacteraceae bacterium]